MTVQYSQLVLTGGPAVFLRLLLKWRGCVLKLIYADILVFSGLYVLLSCIYRFAMNEKCQRNFEQLVLFTSHFQNMIPIAFILGFYVQLVFNRFWHTFNSVPWILKFCLILSAHLPANSDRARLIRRTCTRYLLASLILTSTRLHLIAKKRFPTLDHFVTAGALTEEEVKVIMATQPVHIQPFVPIVWATSLITLAEKERMITNHHALALLINEVNTFRQGLLNLFLLDYVSVPLVYTQVVSLTVYCYFAASLVSSQFIIEGSPYASKRNFHDLYIPVFTLLEFIIYVGWLKVAETLVNPMGEDDEDLDINEVIDYNWKAAWCIVDGTKSSPALVRDAHWNQTFPELPHTEESRRLCGQGYRGSTYDLSVPGGHDVLGSLQSISVPGRQPDLDSGYTRRQSRRSAAPANAVLVDASGERSPAEELLNVEVADEDVGRAGLPDVVSPESDRRKIGAITEPILEETEAEELAAQLEDDNERRAASSVEAIPTENASESDASAPNESSFSNSGDADDVHGQRNQTPVQVVVHKASSGQSCSK